jgi:hypothetical protein
MRNRKALHQRTKEIKRKNGPGSLVCHVKATGSIEGEGYRTFEGSARPASSPENALRTPLVIPL